MATKRLGYYLDADTGEDAPKYKKIQSIVSRATKAHRTVTKKRK